ncbi:HAD family hydrolase [Georgenia sp. MJ170]|uniref:HAD family hydrolase n=1 Tax=Georgenia sunbinii TaxID=3117728 RepID=UPI002F261CF2
MLGLPDGIRACLFDLDGVLTQTAAIHTRAWAQTFDEYLRRHAALTGQPFQPFDVAADYATYVDGKPRMDGVRDFLASRGITLPAGNRDDDGDQETVAGVGNRKNELLLRLIAEEGVDVFEGSARYLHAAREAGLACAVVSSSANAALVLEVTGLDDDITVLVDGSLAHALGMPGKPAPDTFLEGARRLGVVPSEAVVFEDALAGVAAGRAGNFGYVVGVDRLDQADALSAAGADIVVADLGELL